MSGGTCRSCGGDGRVGSPCTSKACSDDGLHYLPESDAAAYRATDRARREPLVGTYVGKFLILKRLGRGGFGRVLLGLQRPLFKSHVAIKILTFETPDEMIRAVVSDKFVQEAETLSTLRHPNIVRFVDFEHDGPVPFLAMEFIPGGQTLTRALSARKGKPMPARVVQHVVDQVLRALNAMHRVHLIHRDLKPDNIMLDRVDGDDWVVKVVDFGLAKDVAQSPDTRFIAGTAEYMAPEQLTRGSLGPATDMYALAVIAFALLTGRALFPDTQDVVLAAKRDPSHDPLVRHADLDLSPETRAFFRIALATRPEQRFRTAEAFGAALRELTSGTAAAASSEARAGADPTYLVPESARGPSLVAQPTGHDRGSATRRPPRRAAWIAGGALVVVGVTAAAIVASSGAGGATSAEAVPVTHVTAPTAVTTPAAFPPSPGPLPPATPAPAAAVVPAPIAVVTPPPAPPSSVFRLETRPPGVHVKLPDGSSVTTPSEVSASPGTKLELSLAGCRTMTYAVPGVIEATATVIMTCTKARSDSSGKSRQMGTPPGKDPNAPTPADFP